MLSGGNNIPEEIVRRRYERGLTNLFELYLPKVNSWRLIDASNIISVEIARYSEVTGEIVYNEELWNKIGR